jgi:phage protein D
MTVRPLHAGRTFLAPAFRLVLADRELRGEPLHDVVDVSYTDDLENLDSFEVTLADWDPVRNLPKYSSPVDPNHDVARLDNGEPVPNFEPGAKVALYLGYRDEGDLVLVMRGEVVSISPRFPASGAPTVKVRAVNALHRLLDEKRPGAYEGTNFEIARAVADDIGVEIETPPAGDEPVLERVVFHDQYPIVALANLARRTGCRLWLDERDEGPVLRMERGPSAPPAYALEWGKTLIHFTPTLTTRGQVAKVTVHGVDLTRAGDDRKIQGEATWDDLDVDRDSLDADSEGELRSAVRTREEDIYHEPVTSEAEATARARAYLRAMALGLVTADGSTIGTPELRAGRAVRIAGLGRRFDGTYTLTETTHTIAGAGYVVKFKARKEIVR